MLVGYVVSKIFTRLVATGLDMGWAVVGVVGVTTIFGELWLLVVLLMRRETDGAGW